VAIFIALSFLSLHPELPLNQTVPGLRKLFHCQTIADKTL